LAESAADIFAAVMLPIPEDLKQAGCDEIGKKWS
jgi:hypothetical protein